MKRQTTSQQLLTCILCMFQLPVLAGIQPIQASDPKGDWIISKDSGCKVWNPNPKPDETISWSGKCSSEGKALGKGILIWFKEGIKTNSYEGEMQDGKRVGKGLSIGFKEGKETGRYEGEFRDNKFHGKGILIWADGNRYEGSFVEGTRTGLGKFTWVSGDYYEGDFIDGIRKGKGTFRWINGSYYEGEWNHIRQGFGKLFLIKGDSGIASWEKIKQGRWEGNYYLIEGGFEEGDLVQNASGAFLEKVDHTSIQKIDRYILKFEKLGYSYRYFIDEDIESQLKKHLSVNEIKDLVNAFDYARSMNLSMKGGEKERMMQLQTYKLAKSNDNRDSLYYMPLIKSSAGIIKKYTLLARENKISSEEYKRFVDAFAGIFTENFKYFSQIPQRSMFNGDLYRTTIEAIGYLLPLYKDVYNTYSKFVSTNKDKENMAYHSLILLGYYSFISNHAHSSSLIPKTFSQDVNQFNSYLQNNYFTSIESFDFGPRSKAAFQEAYIKYVTSLNLPYVDRLTQSANVEKRLKEIFYKASTRTWMSSDEQAFRKLVSDILGVPEAEKEFVTVLKEGIKISAPTIKKQSFKETGLKSNFPLVRRYFEDEKGNIYASTIADIDTYVVTWTITNTLPRAQKFLVMETSVKEAVGKEAMVEMLLKPKSSISHTVNFYVVNADYSSISSPKIMIDIPMNRVLE